MMSKWPSWNSSGSSPKFPALDHELHGHLTKSHHPFTSTLVIAVVPLKQPARSPCCSRVATAPNSWL